MTHVIDVPQVFDERSFDQFATGFAADVVVFDPDEVRDTATFDEPHTFPEGISLVLVNGATGWAADGSPSVRAGVSVRRN